MVPAPVTGIRKPIGSSVFGVNAAYLRADETCLKPSVLTSRFRTSGALHSGRRPASVASDGAVIWRVESLKTCQPPSQDEKTLFHRFHGASNLN